MTMTTTLVFFTNYIIAGYQFNSEEHGALIGKIQEQLETLSLENSSEMRIVQNIQEELIRLKVEARPDKETSKGFCVNT